MSKFWAACPQKDVCIAQFEEASFYYHRPTGETHLLNAFPREIVDLLSKKSLTSNAIAKHLAELCDEENSDAWQQKIKEVLSDLHMLGLITETYS